MMKKSFTFLKEICFIFLGYKERNNNVDIVRYSKVGAILPSQKLNRGMSGAHSIFTAKMYIIKTAIGKSSKTTMNKATMGHSQSGFRTLKTNTYNSAMVTEI